jgi:hypothetical protein
MTAAWLARLLVATAPSFDGLAPDGPGFAAQGEQVTVVVRLPNGRPETVKLLISDAQTDAPIQG